MKSCSANLTPARLTRWLRPLRDASEGERCERQAERASEMSETSAHGPERARRRGDESGEGGTHPVDLLHPPPSSRAAALSHPTPASRSDTEVVLTSLTENEAPKLIGSSYSISSLSRARWRLGGWRSDRAYWASTEREKHTSFFFGSTQGGRGRQRPSGREETRDRPWQFQR